MTEKLGFRWFVVILVAAAAVWAGWNNWPLNKGIDLSGGTTITYSIPSSAIRELVAAGEDPEQARGEVIEVISTRIDSLGLRELGVRGEGTDRIVISAPTMSDAERDDIKARMVQLGNLRFLIGVGQLQGRPTQSLQVAGVTPGSKEAYAFDENKAEELRKAAIAAGKGQAAGYRDGTPYRLTDSSRPEGRQELPIVWYPWRPRAAAERNSNLSEKEVKKALRDSIEGRPYDENLITGAWFYEDPDFYGPTLPGFTGRDIGSVQPSQDQFGKRVVVYTVRKDRRGEFEEYTERYVDKPMAIVLNDEVWSAPNIDSALYDNVQIRGGGNGFTEEEQKWLVNCLQSGSLKVKPRYVGEENVTASLGDTAIGRGVFASVLGLILIVVFLVVYYRFGGMVAVLSLVVNLGLIVALLALFRATLTLPGIAGLILTIGMSVDANILIFERIREELAKGKTLMAAMEAGFDRAFVTILDANITTMLTAVALFHYGVGPIKGFAVTLMAGIVCSLFAALYFSRSIFGLALKQGWMTRFSMMRIVPPDLRVPFMSKAKPALAGSVVLVALSLVAFFGAGEEKYGLDFTGGVSLRMNLNKGMTTAEVKEKLLEIRDPAGAPMFRAVEATGVADGAVEGGFNIIEARLQVPTEASPEVVERILGADIRGALGGAVASLETPQKGEEDTWSIEFTLNEVLRQEVVDSRLAVFTDASGRVVFQLAQITPIDGTEDPVTEEVSSKKWRVSVGGESFLGEQVRPAVAEKFTGLLDATKPFEKMDYVGPNVVANLTERAVTSIIVSLIGILLYIWFRFKELKYGVAAAVAVFHDVVISLGIVVTVNAIGLIHVPLSLSIIAGFLTILGYSLNDTIVLFDRVRENLGNIKASYRELLDISINQTLARTLLTSVTTFVVVFILFVLNYGQESPIEGLAFTLMLGVIVGTYSSIFVASPVLNWLHDRDTAKADAKASAKKVTAKT